MAHDPNTRRLAQALHDGTAKERALALESLEQAHSTADAARIYSEACHQAVKDCGHGDRVGTS